MPDIVAIRNRITDIVGEVDGITTTQKGTPRNVQGFELPMAFVRHAGSEAGPRYSNRTDHTVNMEVVVFVQEIEIDLRTVNEDKALSLANDITQAMQNRPRLEATTTPYAPLSGIYEAYLAGEPAFGAEEFPVGQDLKMYWRIIISMDVDIAQYTS